MANIMDYLDWRGDLSFEQSPFNEVDNLILSQLVYVDLAGIVPKPDEKEKITISEASRIFFQTHDEKKIMEKISMTKTAMYVLRKMAETERFKDALLGGYVNDISLQEQSQFSVVCVYLSDESLFVAFSGTDDTIVGWRENFNMGFLSETPGQLKAVDYLNHMVELEQLNVRVGGHSKGGNLSVYAAIHCDWLVKRKIVEVYNNDGPGVSQAMIETEAYQEMIPKIHTILPESSIIGLILEHEEDYKVVKSSNIGIGQHDAMSWEVIGNHFVYSEHVTQESILLDEAMRIWIRQLDKQQREEMVNAVFEVLEEAKIRTVDDFYHIRWKTIQDIFKARKELPEETMKLMTDALKLLWKVGNDAIKKNVKETLHERKELHTEKSSFLKKV